MEPVQDERLTPLLQDLPQVRLVYLFGSRATGTAGPTSDRDIAVALDRPEAFPGLQVDLRPRLSRLYPGERIDLVCLNRAPIELAYAIIATGRILYEKDVATRVDFEADVLARYGDYLPVLRQQRADLIKGGGDDARIQRYRAALERARRQAGPAPGSG